MGRSELIYPGLVVAYFSAIMLLAAEWPDSWLEAIDPSVVVECRSEVGTSVVIGFSPWLGRIRYDGSRKSGDVTRGTVAFRFTNVNNKSCEWIVSRVSGEADLRCEDKSKTDLGFTKYACVRKDETLF